MNKSTKILFLALLFSAGFSSLIYVLIGTKTLGTVLPFTPYLLVAILAKMIIDDGVLFIGIFLFTSLLLSFICIKAALGLKKNRVLFAVISLFFYLFNFALCISVLIRQIGDSYFQYHIAVCSGIMDIAIVTLLMVYLVKNIRDKKSKKKLEQPE